MASNFVETWFKNASKLVTWPRIWWKHGLKMASKLVTTWPRIWWQDGVKMALKSLNVWL